MRAFETKSDDRVWYFLREAHYKYANSKRAHRATKGGNWKITGRGCDVKDKGRVIGKKRTLVFCRRGSTSKECHHDTFSLISFHQLYIYTRPYLFMVVPWWCSISSRVVWGFHSFWELIVDMFRQGHIDGSDKAPMDVSKLAQWQTKDARWLMLLKEKVRDETYGTFNALVARNMGILPPTANAYQATIDSASSATPSASSALTPEKVQQMIIFALSALGLQGNGSLSPSWIIDSGASNHMTSSSDILGTVRTYTGSTHIQIANGCRLPIHAIGDVDSTIRDVFVSPQLSTRSGVGQDTCEGA
ncbi:hypothetical protein Pint_15332 [Pistacia integerrima]|uniref:Uncharacterized protein n=1 Tax=Pistacia integerrima TaxID=434235 RepID=A0ACC0ZB85_9ROSI|nr:hypothetical protein Pint_15332 [Pistacia integerrima]